MKLKPLGRLEKFNAVDLCDEYLKDPEHVDINVYEAKQVDAYVRKLKENFIRAMFGVYRNCRVAILNTDKPVKDSQIKHVIRNENRFYRLVRKMKEANKE